MKPADLMPKTDPIIGPGRVLSFEVERSGVPKIFAATHVERDAAGAVMAAVVGPGPADGRSLMRWLERGSPDPAPQRQGFVALLFRPDGHVTAAVSARNEVALYFRYANGDLMGSSSLKGLIGRLPQAPPLDLQKLTDLCFEYDDPHRTWFVGLDRLPPSHVADFYPNRPPRVRRWFDPPVVPIDRRPLKSAPEIMRETVRDAVEASLPASGDVAASLSGGLDSTMIAATAASILRSEGREVHGFTHVPLSGTESGRTGWVASDQATVECLVEATPGLSFEPVVSDQSWTVVEALLEQFRLTCSPHRNIANADWLLEIRKRVDQKGYALTLGGQSGNFGFSWNGSAGVDEFVRQGRPLGAYRHARERAGPAGASKATLKALFPRAADCWLDFRHNRTAEPWQSRSGLRGAPTPGAIEAWAQSVRGQGVGTQAFRRRFLLGSPSYQAVAQPPASISWRSDPLSDSEVLRLALSIHPSAWRMGFDSRSVARSAMRGVVPDQVRLRRERGMQGADGHLRLRHDPRGLDLSLDLIAGSPLASEFVDVAQIRREVIEGGHSSQAAYLGWCAGAGRLMGYALFVAWWDRVGIQDRNWR